MPTPPKENAEIPIALPDQQHSERLLSPAQDAFAKEIGRKLAENWHRRQESTKRLRDENRGKFDCVHARCAVA